MAINLPHVRPWTRQQAMQPGDLFSARNTGADILGFVFGYADDEWVLLLRKVGTYGLEPMHAHYLGRGAFEGGVVLGDAWIEPATTAFGTPFAERHPEPGAVVVDAQGQTWILIHHDHSQIFVNLSTGRGGRPVEDVTAYNSWKLLWSPAPGTDAVVLMNWPQQNDENTDITAMVG